MDIEYAVAIVREEVERATSKFGSFHSAHEGYAVILEELDELKREVFKYFEDRDPRILVKESTQVAAMSIRFLIDLC